LLIDCNAVLRIEYNSDEPEPSTPHRLGCLCDDCLEILKPSDEADSGSSMPLTLGCVRCARNVDTDWRYCPFCGASQATRTELLGLIRCTPLPQKARVLSTLLSQKLGSEIKKQQVNQILYRLLRSGIVQKDADFRWSLTLTAQIDVPKDEQPAERSSLESPPRPELPERVKTALSSQIGHWIFTLETDARNGRDLWGFRCLLCGLETKHQSQPPGYYVLPLSGSLRARRLKHDRKAHPDTVNDQVAAEKARLGSYFRQDRLALEPMHRPSSAFYSGSVTVDRLMPVDRLIRKSAVGHRLTRGFRILNSSSRYER
jgi:hypothetical protein